MIVYNKLARILESRNMTWKDLVGSGISVNMPYKLSSNARVNTDTIDRICSFLKVQPGDIMEWVENEDVLKRKEIEEQIAVLQEQLKSL